MPVLCPPERLYDWRIVPTPGMVFLSLPTSRLSLVVGLSSFASSLKARTALPGASAVGGRTCFGRVNPAPASRQDLRRHVESPRVSSQESRWASRYT